MLILDTSFQSIVLRRNRGSLAADFSSLDTKWMEVRAVEPAFDRKPRAVTESKSNYQTLIHELPKSHGGVGRPGILAVPPILSGKAWVLESSTPNLSAVAASLRA
jgi:hypothetical protein